MDQNIRLSGKLLGKRLIKHQQMCIYTNKPVSINLSRVLPYANRELIPLLANQFLIHLGRFHANVKPFHSKICVKKFDGNPSILSALQIRTSVWRTTGAALTCVWTSPWASCVTAPLAGCCWGTLSVRVSLFFPSPSRYWANYVNHVKPSCIIACM